MNWTYEVFESQHGGWGYRILLNGVTVIQQPFIPCVAGFRGFSSREDAERVASFLIQKIQENGNQLVGLTLEDLVNLGVLV